MASIVGAIIGVPYIIGALSSTSDRIFTGFLVGRIGMEDGSAYLARMLQGAQGQWLGHLPHTGQPHMATLFYLFYRVVGSLDQILGIPHIIGFHVIRVALAFLLILVVYRCISEFIESPTIRILATTWLALSGGMGWLSILSGLSVQSVNPPLDLVSPESYTFWMMYTTPHLLLAEICLLIGLILLWRSQKYSTAFIAGFIWLAVTLLQPVYLAVEGAFVMLMVAARSLALHRMAWRTLICGLIAVSLAAPMVIYALIVFSIDPVYAYWANMQQTTSSDPVSFAASYSLLLLMAIGGLRIAWQHRTEPKWLFLILWFLVQPLLLYAPTLAQRRLIIGWQIPLTIFAASGFIQYVRPLLMRRSKLIRRGLTVGLTALLGATYMLLILWNVASVATHASNEFYPATFMVAAQWLGQRVTYADGILASYATSTAIPAYAGVRVLAGHNNETAFVADRTAEIEMFFQVGTSDDWRINLLRQFELTYVWYGPAEQQLGSFDPSRAPYLREVFSSGDIRLYRVQL